MALGMRICVPTILFLRTYLNTKTFDPSVGDQLDFFNVGKAKEVKGDLIEVSGFTVAS